MRAIAAKVEESSRTVLPRVGQEAEELRLDSDELGPRMAVTKHSFHDRSQSALPQQLERSRIACIPGRFQVDEHMNVAALRGVLNGDCIFVADGQGLLHHHVDAQCGAFVDHSPVLAGSGGDQHCLGTRLRNHFLNAAEVQAWGEMIALCIGLEEFLVGFNNANQLYVGAIQKSAGWREPATLQKALDMTMHHADYTDFHGRAGRGVGSAVSVNNRKSKHQHKNQFHDVPPQLSSSWNA